jgi:hypothetical protein
VCGGLFSLGFRNAHHHVRRLGEDIIDIRGHASLLELNLNFTIWLVYSRL